MARNDAQGFTAALSGGALHVAPANSGAGWSFELRWTGVGHGDDIEPVAAPSADLTIDGNRATYLRSNGSEEWYLHGPLGLEQGFVVAERVANQDGPLVLELTVLGDIAPRLDPERSEAIELVAPDGEVVLRYTDLYVTDADGRPLAAVMQVGPGTIRLVIDDAGARYPLHVDPLIWVQHTKLLPSDGGFERFGGSVAFEGDTAIVGASGGTGNVDKVGQAYVFVHNAGVWSEQDKLVPADGVVMDGFGRSVSLSGDTVIAGAPFHDDQADMAGAAYTFVRNGNVWTEQAELLASDPVAGAGFGSAVAINGDTALVGAIQTLYPGPDAGAAYAFVRVGGVWSEQQKLLPLDQGADDTFGSSVSVDGDTAIVGAPDHRHGNVDTGAAYVFVRNGGVWSEEQELVPGDSAKGDSFGWAVSLSGDRAMVGARIHGLGGAAYVFVRSGGVWTAADPDDSPCPNGACQSGSCQPAGTGGSGAGGGGNTGAGGTSGESDSDGDDDGGCGCRLQATRSLAPWWSALALIALSLLVSRRRRR